MNDPPVDEPPPPPSIPEQDSEIVSDLGMDSKDTDVNTGSAEEIDPRDEPGPIHVTAVKVIKDNVTGDKHDSFSENTATSRDDEKTVTDIKREAEGRIREREREMEEVRETERVIQEAKKTFEEVRENERVVQETKKVVEEVLQQNHMLDGGKTVEEVLQELQNQKEGKAPSDSDTNDDSLKEDTTTDGEDSLPPYEDEDPQREVDLLGR